MMATNQSCRKSLSWESSSVKSFPKKTKTKPEFSVTPSFLSTSLKPCLTSKMKNSQKSLRKKEKIWMTARRLRKLRLSYRNSKFNLLATYRKITISNPQLPKMHSLITSLNTSVNCSTTFLSQILYPISMKNWLSNCTKTSKPIRLCWR